MSFNQSKIEEAPFTSSTAGNFEGSNGALRGAHRPKSGVSANEFTIVLKCLLVNLNDIYLHCKHCMHNDHRRESMKQTIAVRLAPDDVQRLRVIAEQFNHSVSYVTNIMITEGLNHYARVTAEKKIETGPNLLSILERKQTSTHSSNNS